MTQLRGYFSLGPLSAIYYGGQKESLQAPKFKAGKRIELIHRGVSSLAFIKSLLKKLNPLNSKEVGEFIFRSVRNGSIKIFKYLMKDERFREKLFQINHSTDENEDLIGIASSFGELKMLKYLITEYGFYQKKFTTYNLGEGYEGGKDETYLSVLRYLMDSGAELNPTNYSILEEIVVYDVFNAAKYFAGLVENLEGGEITIPLDIGGKDRPNHSKIMDFLALPKAQRQKVSRSFFRTLETKDLIRKI